MKILFFSFVCRIIQERNVIIRGQKKLTVLERSGNSWIRRFAFNGLIEGHDEELIGGELSQSTNFTWWGARSAVENSQHFILRLIIVSESCIIDISSVDVESFDVFAVQILFEKEKEKWVQCNKIHYASLGA